MSFCNHQSTNVHSEPTSLPSKLHKLHTKDVCCCTFNELDLGLIRKVSLILLSHKEVGYGDKLVEN